MRACVSLCTGEAYVLSVPFFGVLRWISRGCPVGAPIHVNPTSYLNIIMGLSKSLQLGLQPYLYSPLLDLSRSLLL